QFKNRRSWSVLGWISSIILIFLNLYNLPATFVSFNIMPKQDAKIFAYAIIVLIILLLAWTCWDMEKSKIRH
ncbi:MAG: divalent metal cation transporter, partial [Lactobacillus crispatus]|nr:divalent metal cation transporter [Lactobacillus crispatus]